MDDTLSECSPFYTQCRENFADFSYDRTRIPKDIILSILDSIDVACTELAVGFGKERFPRSFAATSAALDIIQGKEVNDLAAEQSYLIGEEVFSAEYPLYEGVREMLMQYKNGGHQLILFTKGDSIVQWNKIDKNRLQDIFDRDHIYIVGKKDGFTLERILIDQQLDPTDTAIIGDSIRDDIGSGKEVGIKTIWVNNQQKRPWAYEDKNHIPDYTINKVVDLPTLVSYDALPFVNS